MKYARIEVRDKKGIYDAVAEGLKKDIKDLGISGVKDVEYVQVYTLRGNFLKKDLKFFAEEALTDKVSQEYNCDGGFISKERKGLFIRETTYNPGVMDPVEESATKAAKDIKIKGIDTIHTSKKYIIKGNLSKAQVDNITERLLYNKTVQHVVTDQEEEKNLKPYKFSYVEVDLLNASDEKLKKLSRQMQLYLTLEEMQTIKKYFKKSQ